jgi:hypothetical protein
VLYYQRADPNASAETAEVQALHMLLEHGLTLHALTQDETALARRIRTLLHLPLPGVA